MTQKSTALTYVIRQVRRRELFLVVFITALFFVACQKGPEPANQQTSSASSPKEGSALPTASPSGTRSDYDDDHELQALDDSERIVCSKKDRAGSHDDPIIVTDGSIHIKTRVASFDNNFQDFTLAADDTKLILNKPAQVYLAKIITHYDEGDADKTHTVIYTFDNARSEIKIAYKDKDGTDWPDFLTISTWDRDYPDKLVLRSPIKFSSAAWIKSKHELTFEKGIPGDHSRGHTKVSQKSNTSAPDGSWDEKHGKSRVEFRLSVNN